MCCFAYLITFGVDDVGISSETPIGVSKELANTTLDRQSRRLGSHEAA
jgi:hypothetical protein